MSKEGQQPSNGSYLKLILILTVVFHGTVLFYTFERTYDAFVHIFFASHYAEDWFSVWNQKWYTGFTTVSYPPLIHQLIALTSKAVGLKLSFILVATASSLVFVSGVYRFSKIWVSERASLVAAAAAIVSTSFMEALHVFGQLPSIMGIALLLHNCPEIYQWLRKNKNQHLFISLALFGVTSATHHVSTIFGMVFFVFPVIGKALVENSEINFPAKAKFTAFLLELKSKFIRLLFLGIASLTITIFVIFPYWYWSKTDPISQVPIPHGSRDSYLEVLSSGLIFFIIPWGLMLFFLPYLIKRLVVRNHIFLLISISTAFILGTGGTTPFPRMVLGESAFNILTLDRFTIWATVLSLPFWGEAILLLFRSKYRWLQNTFIIASILSTVFIINIDYFRKLQPTKIDVQPIVDFMHRDQHSDWRYLTLGFGDQMAWLSANCKALSVDGNYHSARRLPELTSKAVERIENSKYLGLDGISALNDFLTQSDKYHLKYTFSNDQFYDPLLYFTGWKKLGQLENKINVWEKPDIKPLPKILPSRDLPRYQKLIWGLAPFSFLILSLLLILFRKRNPNYPLAREDKSTVDGLIKFQKIWIILLILLFTIGLVLIYTQHNPHKSKEQIISSYFDAIDFKEFEKAYSYIHFNEKSTYEQFYKTISQQNGILNSYAKLKEIKIESINGDNNYADANVKSIWLTALHQIERDHELKLVKKNSKWYIQLPKLDLSIPPDQFRSLPEVNFNQLGRRKINDDRTNRQDVLDRPKAEIIQANLIKADSTYFVTGELVNTDVDPAFVTITAIAYDEYGNEIEHRNAGEEVNPHLLSLEKTSFKIDFKTNEKVVDFAIFVNTLVNPTNYYRYSGNQNIRIFKSGKIKGEIVNYGNEEMTIPQLLINQYDKEKRLVNVQKHYLSTGVRSQRSQNFELILDLESAIQFVKSGNKENLFVNGSRQAISESYNDNDVLNSVPFQKFKYISIQENSFVKYD